MHNKATTVSIDAKVRDAINAEAEKLGLSQRQMVARIMEAYMHVKDETPEQAQAAPSISEANIDALLQGDDRIIAIIRKQEANILNPLLQIAQTTQSRLENLVSILSNLS